MINQIITINPYTNTVLENYTFASNEAIQISLEKADTAFNIWKKEEISSRIHLLNNLTERLLSNKLNFAKLITSEMGKPIKESLAEIEKCIFLCDFYIKNSEDLLADELIKTEAQESFISYDPLGCILGIMPWNFPFWQVFRFAIPTLMAGNVVLLKHASNTTGCALAIENLFKESGFIDGCFTTLLATYSDVEIIIKHDAVKAISLTGSEAVGKRIAQLAGAELKPLVLELGGNNACIVLNDADLEKHIDVMVNSRMQNSGQSCIAAKRFIVESGIYEAFLEQFTSKIAALNIGDPLLETTDISVLARPDLVKDLNSQVSESIKMGATLHFGNEFKGNFYQPTILTDVTIDMPVFKEETFGPVAAITKVSNKNEAYKLAGQTKFGLGTMVFTEDIEDAKHRIIDIADGSFYINEMIKSDPRLPFGGTKYSGYGRELSREGLLAFVNLKTVLVK